MTRTDALVSQRFRMCTASCVCVVADFLCLTCLVCAEASDLRRQFLWRRSANGGLRFAQVSNGLPTLTGPVDNSTCPEQEFVYDRDAGGLTKAMQKRWLAELRTSIIK